MILLFALLAVDVDALAKNPGVGKIERVLPGKRLIVHVADWHFVPKIAIGEAEGLTGDELDREHAKLLGEVATVHRSTMEILEGQAAVFQEGLTDRNAPIVFGEIKGLAAYHVLLRRSRGEDADHETKLLRLGAAAELLLDGKGVQLLPADEHAAHEAARGAALDHPAHTARRQAIVKNIVARGKPAIVVLGGGHNLTAAIKQHEGWGYVRIWPVGHPDAK